jgi:hypothetical protein
VRRHQQRLVEAALARAPRGEHVRCVGERLDAIEYAHRSEGHTAERQRARHWRQRLDQSDTVAAAGRDDPQQPVARLGASEQCIDIAGDLVDVEREAQILR